MAKTFVIDGAIEDFNLCKYFTIICDHPDPIVDFIHNTLKRSATLESAEGSYLHQKKTIIMTVTRRRQAVLRSKTAADFRSFNDSLILYILFVEYGSTFEKYPQRPAASQFRIIHRNRSGSVVKFN